MSMSLRMLAVSAAFALAGAAFAATPQADQAAPAAKPHSAQQQRMIDCNKQATGKKGAERKAFMSSCLKGHAAAAPTAGQACTASIFILLYTAILYLATDKRRVLLATAAGLVLAGILGYLFIDVVRVRLDACLNPWDDPSGRSYQIIQSLLAVANGGIV